MDINTIIIRVLTGECSGDDMSQFLDWINTSSTNKEEFKKIHSYWNSSVIYNHRITAEESLNKTLKRIHHEQVRRQKVYKILRYSLLVASCVLCFVIGALVHYNQTDTPTVQYVCLNEDSMSTFYMSDSTKIVLNNHSKLIYTDDFGHSNRHVKLVGEAYFEVTKNPHLPFIIDMGDASIKVLGTKFTVKNREDQEMIKAVLVEGAISFSSSQQQVLMKPNQQLLYNKKNNQIEYVSEIDTQIETSWKDGLLRFKSELLSEIIEKLSHFYHVEIILSDRIKKDQSSRYSASFETCKTLEQILGTLNKTVKFTWYEKNGRFYVD